MTQARQVECIDRQKQIFLHKEVFTQSQCSEITDNLGKLATSGNIVKNFSEEKLAALVLWSKKTSKEPIPRFVLPILESIEEQVLSGLYLPENLRSFQFNTQEPGVEQTLHTDYPFSRTAVVHLSPKGIFEYINANNSSEVVRTDMGDVLTMGNADTTYHLGANHSTATRHTLALFF